MKIKTLTWLSALLIISAFLINGCKKTTEDEFNDANGDVAEKLVHWIEITSDDFNEKERITVSYDGKDRVSSIIYGETTHYFVYDEYSNLSKITDEGEPKDIGELFLSPYDIDLTVGSGNRVVPGNVLKFDSKGNPIEIEFFENTMSWNYFGSGSFIIKTDTLTCEIIYDPNPNPIFYTLKAAKVVDALDRLELIFGSQSLEIIKAKQLLPYNNIKSMIFKDLNGIPKSEITINSTYDEDKYPTSATVVVTNSSGSFFHLVNYYYK